VSDSVLEARSLNREVAALNRWLRRAAESENHRFINLNETLGDSRGLSETYTVDGVHLSDAGYRRWGEVIAPMLAPDSQ
jgi:lysophospholipase L1-like esterase